MPRTPEQIVAALEEIQKEGNPEGWVVINFVIEQLRLGNLKVAKGKILLDNDKLVLRGDVIEILSDLFTEKGERKPYSIKS